MREALHTRTLWLLVWASNLASLTFSTQLPHLTAYLQDTGMSLQAATFVWALYNTAAIFSKLLWGFLAERLPVRFCLMENYLGHALGLLLLLMSRAPERVYAYIFVTGLLSHGFGPLQALIWADYYYT